MFNISVRKSLKLMLLCLCTNVVVVLKDRVNSVC